MNETVENLILVHLGEMCVERAAPRSDMLAIRAKVKESRSSVGARVDGVARLLTLPVAHVHCSDQRVERLEEAIVR
jgi:hypothetical protein